ncbi:hypothetical protein [Ferrimicrobium sp.]|uniref:MutS-related protein n=1 Tax=Ferrimicrobium sp. TaxID=2926050 RepID=UPI002607C8E7|nr:hypothetical protein [Ferrimicrobium sp.]
MYLREMIRRDPGTSWVTSQLVSHQLAESDAIKAPESLVNPTAEIGRAIDDFVLTDLALDRLFAAIDKGLEPFDLLPYFTTLPQNLTTIRYRQDVASDLLVADNRLPILAFCECLERVELQLEAAERARQPSGRDRWLLDAVLTYTRGIESVIAHLGATSWRSAGLKGLQDALLILSQTNDFLQLSRDAESVASELESISYQLLLEDNAITVERSEGGARTDGYRDHLLRLFARFGDSNAQGMTTSATRRSTTHVDDRILVILGRIFPDQFAHLSTFANAHQTFLPTWVASIERELVFYLAWIEEILAFEGAGLPWVVPKLNRGIGQEHAEQIYDLALAHDLLRNHTVPVTNQWHLDNDELITVITGPNNGGKTTYTRSIGQLYLVTALGLPVGASVAQLTPPPSVATIFSEQEVADRMTGRLEEEIINLQHFLRDAAAQALLLANEVFSSTSVDDAVILGRLLIERCQQKQVRCIIVTFVEALAAQAPGVVSLVALSDEATLERSFRLERRPPQGRALALELAAQYGLITGVPND